jgi:hypothetical protein
MPASPATHDPAPDVERVKEEEEEDATLLTLPDDPSTSTIRAATDAVEADARARLARVQDGDEEGAAVPTPTPTTPAESDPDAAAISSAIEATFREEVSRAWEAADTARERVRGERDRWGTEGKCGETNSPLSLSHLIMPSPPRSSSFPRKRPPWRSFPPCVST